MLEREQIKSLIQSHYNMINRLEKMLNEEESVLQTYGHEIENIIKSVNEVFNTNCTERSRRKNVVYARHLAIFLIRKYTLLSLNEVAISVGLNDHSTALHSIKTAQNLMETDEAYIKKYKLVEDKLKFYNLQN